MPKNDLTLAKHVQNLTRITAYSIVFTDPSQRQQTSTSGRSISISISMSPQKTRYKSKIFYGWYIVAAAFIILFFNSGARFSFGVIFKPMIAEFGWSRSLISSAYFLHILSHRFCHVGDQPSARTARHKR